MTNKSKYLLYTILDFALTFGGTAGVIVYNYISPDNSTGFKITFTGIVLLVALILFSKNMFEKKYQNVLNTYLQQLAECVDENVKQEISNKINAHKTKMYVYQRLMALLPFIILYIVSWLGSQSLASLQGTVGLILMSMSIGSVFNILKRPVHEKAQMEKLNKKVSKKKKGGR